MSKSQYLGYYETALNINELNVKQTRTVSQTLLITDVTDDPLEHYFVFHCNILRLGGTALIHSVVGVYQCYSTEYIQQVQGQRFYDIYT